MSNKLLLLDCDGTIRQPASGARFIQNPLDQEILPGADKAIAHYAARGYLCIGISNQGGVAAGFKSLEDTLSEQWFTLKLFPQLEAIFFCPDFEGRYCWFVQDSNWALPIHDAQDVPWAAKLSGQFRKPKAGMLLAAHENYAQSSPISEAWYVGDREEDEQAAKNAGCNFLHAEVWRTRFLPGVHVTKDITRDQIAFLEGIDC